MGVMNESIGISDLRMECGGCLDNLNRASLGTLLLALDHSVGVLRDRIEWAIANYGRPKKP